MKKNGNVLAATGIAALFLFLVYATWTISRPKPLEVQGEVEATQVRVASKLTGRIDSLPIHKGDMIKKGQLLFTLSSPELEARLEQANAALKGAKAQNSKAIAGADAEDIQAAHDTYMKAMAACELAEKTYKRVNNLYKEGVLPAQKNDEAETSFRVARETAGAAKAVWEKAKKGARAEDKTAAVSLVERAEGTIREVKSYLDEMNIYSPVDGEISNIIAEEGELVPAGYPVVTIIKPYDSWITFNLREDLLASVSKGSIFSAKFPALGDKEIRLKITYINALGTFATWNATKTSGDFDMKTFEIHATPVKKTDGLRPGMSALVDWRKVKNAD